MAQAWRSLAWLFPCRWRESKEGNLAEQFVLCVYQWEREDPPRETRAG